MLDVESRDDMDFTKLASTAVNALAREVAKTPVSPLMQTNNPARSNLHTRVRAAVRKLKGHGFVYATFRSKMLEVTETPQSGAPNSYELIFENGKFIKCRDAAAVYNG